MQLPCFGKTALITPPPTYHCLVYQFGKYRKLQNIIVMLCNYLLCYHNEGKINAIARTLSVRHCFYHEGDIDRQSSLPLSESADASLHPVTLTHLKYCKCLLHMLSEEYLILQPQQFHYSTAEALSVPWPGQMAASIPVFFSFCAQHKIYYSNCLFFSSQPHQKLNVQNKCVIQVNQKKGLILYCIFFFLKKKNQNSSTLSCSLGILPFLL